MAKKFFAKVTPILKFGIAGGLIFWLVHSGKLDFKDLIQLLEWKIFIACMACTGVSLYVASERWRRLLVAQNLLVPSRLTYKMTLIGTLFNFALPGGVGGDLVRGFYMAKVNANAKSGTAISVLVDRLIGLYVMIFLAIIAMICFHQTFDKPELKITFIFLVIFFAIFSGCWFLLLSKTFHKKQWITHPKFLKIYEGFTIYQNHKKLVLQACGLSVLSQMISFFFFVFAGYGLGYTDVPVGVYFFVVPLGFMLISIPISIAGIGVGQAAFLFLFNTVLNNKSQLGPNVITAYQVSLFLYGLVGAYFYLSFKNNSDVTTLASRFVRK